jgi:hypothetical protein
MALLQVSAYFPRISRIRPIQNSKLDGGHLKVLPASAWEDKISEYEEVDHQSHSEQDGEEGKLLPCRKSKFRSFNPHH